MYAMKGQNISFELHSVKWLWDILPVKLNGYFISIESKIILKSLYIILFGHHLERTVDAKTVSGIYFIQPTVYCTLPYLSHRQYKDA